MYQAPNFKICVLYIDAKKEDARLFFNGLKRSGDLAPFNPQYIHSKSLKGALQWLAENPPDLSDAVTVAVFDPAVPGVDPNASHIAVQKLKAAGLPADCIVALPDPTQTKLVWTVLRGQLDDGHVFDKDDVLRNGGSRAIATLIEGALAKRTSNGERALQFAVLNLENNLRRTQDDIKRLEEKLVGGSLLQIKEQVGELKKRVDTLNFSIFPSHDMTGNPSILSMVQTSRQSIASLLKDTEKLDQDIGALAKTSRDRLESVQSALQDQLDQVMDKVAKLQDLMEKLTQGNEQRFALRIENVRSRNQFLMKFGAIAAAVAALLILGTQTPEVIELINNLLGS